MTPRASPGPLIPLAQSSMSVGRGLPGLAATQGEPAPAQGERGRLRLAVAGEHALLVAVDPVDAGRGLEVGEVPHVLADELGDAVEDPVVHGEEVALVLLA